MLYIICITFIYYIYLLYNCIDIYIIIYIDHYYLYLSFFIIIYIIIIIIIIVLLWRYFTCTQERELTLLT